MSKPLSGVSADPPRVSIVIPVYNGANYLRDAIDSALGQTYRNLEIIVVNDGSRDDGATESIALSYGEKIRYIRQQNGGVSSALNRGIEEMTGSWFSWLSHDDRYLPEKIARQVAYVVDSGARCVACNFQLIDESGGVTGEVVEHGVLDTGRHVLDRWLFGCSLLIDRKLFDETGPFNVENRTTQDLEMWLRVVELVPIHYLPDVLCQLRQHQEAGSQTEVRYEQDKNDLFVRIMARYDLAFFEPERSRTAGGRAGILTWLAGSAANRGAFDAADVALTRAWNEQPNLSNPALFRKFLGIRRWIRFRSMYLRTKSRLGWPMRKLRRILRRS